MKGQKVMELTKEMEQAIVKKYVAGEKAQQIQKELNVAGSSMYGVLRKYDIELRRPAMSDARTKRKKSKSRRCPHCKANNNPVGARFCCMCGADIRSETDVLVERLDKAMTLCIQLLPTTSVEEVVSAMRDAKKIIETQ